MFEKTKSELEQVGAFWTVTEIKQQPDLWAQAFENYKKNKSCIDKFLSQLAAKHERVRVIFTGAGTSAYVGDTILPYIKEVADEKKFDFMSVPTTSAVSNPYQYFKSDIVTLLVSFARSGNSPESVATVELAKQIVKDLYQVTITCAADGALAKNAVGDEKNLLLLMPPKSNDQAFAMTGSFSCMTLTALMVFGGQDLSKLESIVSTIIELGRSVTAREADIQKIIDGDFNRIVYLGSGSFAALSSEARLKVLELTAGETAAIYESSMGFRHGPKSFIDNKTAVFVFVSNQKYSRQYDIDILKEMQNDKIASLIYAISAPQESNYDGDSFSFDKKASNIADAYMALPFIMVAQVIALLSSLKVKNKPDTPSRTGTVNRVVKGVKIHKF